MNSIDSSPIAATFLGQQTACTPDVLFREYARTLLKNSQAWDLPVPLDQVRSHHQWQRRSGPIPQRGFLFGDTIFINSDDPVSVQRFTEAHEMMETLVTALRSSPPGWFPNYSKQKFEKEKEKWCEQGAAELLMPAELISSQVVNGGVSLQSGRKLAQLCKTSLTASVRTLLAMDLAPCVFAILKEGHKKSQVLPSKVGQGVLWGDPADWDPPAELRVWKRWSSPQVKDYLCLNESFSRAGLAYGVFRSKAFGQVVSDRDELNLEYIKGSRTIEAMLVSIADSPAVMTLIHL